ncbi:MAG: hypothetical protein H3Z52_10435 [archaeon]|nr:hypothetical protein [archaeon]MCP8321338.1 hypothetical protein [archaeon]
MVNRSLDGEASRPKFLKRLPTAMTFLCFRCERNKTSKLQAEWHTSQGIKVICNGCYGELVAKARVMK